MSLKVLLVAVGFGFSLQAFASPQLNGTYSCTANVKDAPGPVSVQFATQNNTIVAQGINNELLNAGMDCDNGKETKVEDGVTHTLTVSCKKSKISFSLVSEGMDNGVKAKLLAQVSVLENAAKKVTIVSKISVMKNGKTEKVQDLKINCTK